MLQLVFPGMITPFLFIRPSMPILATTAGINMISFARLPWAFIRLRPSELVSTGPGQRTETPTWVPANSSRRASEKAKI